MLCIVLLFAKIRCSIKLNAVPLNIYFLNAKFSKYDLSSGIRCVQRHADHRRPHAGGPHEKVHPPSVQRLWRAGLHRDAELAGRRGGRVGRRRHRRHHWHCPGGADRAGRRCAHPGCAGHRQMVLPR